MDKNYCKWPVIVAIIVGSLIVISIVACIVNCICCGYRCCTGCCSCCCPSGRRRERAPKYLDNPIPSAPYSHPVNTAYQSPYMPSPYNNRFDYTPKAAAASSPVHDDSLPSMPTYDSSARRYGHSTRDDMEMEPLDQPGLVPPARSKFGRSGYMEVPSDAAEPLPVHQGQDPYHSSSSPYGGQQHYTDHPHERAASQSSRLYTPASMSTAPPTYVSMLDEPEQPSQSRFYNQHQSPPAELSYDPYSAPTGDEGRHPSILVSGRKPAPGSTRVV